MVVGGDKEQVEALSADDKQRQLTTFLFIQSQPLDVVKKAVKLARENRQAFEDEYLLPFELELPVTAMFTAMQQLENNLTAIEAAQIEVITRPERQRARSRLRPQTDRAGVDGELRLHTGARNRMVGALHLLGAAARAAPAIPALRAAGA